VPAPAGLEGGLQGSHGRPGSSFEAFAALRHLRMRGMDGMRRGARFEEDGNTT